MASKKLSLLLAPALAAGLLLSAAPAEAAPAPARDGNGFIIAPARTEIAYFDMSNGTWSGTGNSHESRPGLSLVKMFIADFVVRHGDPADIPAAMNMIRFSDDGIASSLYGKYPDSINATARDYGLSDTHGAAHWGNSTTSAADTAKFVVDKRINDPSSPVLTAMSQMNPVAADGYHQDYGTSTIACIDGSKLGWSDDRVSVHASVSFGPDFVVSAITYGDSGTLTSDVRSAIPDPNLLAGTPLGSSSTRVGYQAVRDLARGAAQRAQDGGLPVDPAVTNFIPAGFIVPAAC